MAFTIFCAAALDGTPVTVFGDGTQTRDFTFVSDVVAATRQAGAVAGVGGKAYNIGGGAQVSLNEAISIIEACAGRRLDLRRTETQHGDVQDTSADTTRARAELGLSGAVPVEEGLARQFQWLAADGRRAAALDPA
jgi:UDP-glucose 4-epimerase